MKHIIPFTKYNLTENKENDINSSSLDKEIDFSNEILNEYSFKKIDFYYLKSNVDEMLVKEMYDMIENNEYRAFATFAENIKYFEELPCTLIALVNYPAERFTKRTIINKLAEVGKYEYVEEIEFPWSMKYMEFGVEFWREIVLEYSNKGIILRPMVEFGIYNNEDVHKVIEFFKKINIMTIMTSSGMYPEITTIERWEEIKEIIPNKWIVKIGGILTIGDINKFIKSDVDLAATTISLVSAYGKELGLE
jgi:deoxyribose-phosphate aldolase